MVGVAAVRTSSTSASTVASTAAPAIACFLGPKPFTVAISDMPLTLGCLG